MLAEGHPFPAEYEASVVDAPPSGHVDIEFSAGPGATRVVAIHIVPQGDAAGWLANVAVGEPMLRQTVSGLFSTPCSTVLCIVEAGTALLTNVQNPVDHQVVPTDGPVVAVRAAVNESLLLLVTPWAVTAIGVEGLRWTSARIALEGVRVDEIEEGWLRGVADPDDESRDFALELSNGRLVGGSLF